MTTFLLALLVGGLAAALGYAIEAAIRADRALAERLDTAAVPSHVRLIPNPREDDQ